MGTRMDGSVLAVLAAYQTIWCRQKMMTPQVVQCLPTQMSEKNDSG